MRLQLLRLAALLVLVVLAFAQAQSVHGQTDALMILDPANPHTVEFAKDGTATVKITIQNAADRQAALLLTLFDAGRNQTVSVGAPLDPAGVSITGPATAPRLSPGQVTRLDITLQAGSSVEIGKFKGVLVISAEDASITGASLNISGAAAAKPFTGAKTEPSSITLTATRCHPSVAPIFAHCWLGEMAAAVGAPGGFPTAFDSPRYRLLINAAPSEPLPEEISAYLSSDTGGRLRVYLTQFESQDKRVSAMLRLGETDRAGKYTGKIFLDQSDEKAPTIDLIINVQDAVFWPLLVLLLGVAGAYLVTRIRDRYRPRRVAIAELRKAHDNFVKTKKSKKPSADELTWMSGLFPNEVVGESPLITRIPRALKETWLRFKRWVRREKQSSKPKSEIRAEVLELELSEASDQAQLDKVIAEIREFIELVGSWPSLLDAATRLREKLADAPKIDPAAKVFKRAAELAGAKKEPLARSAEAKSFLSDLNDQVAAIELVRAARALYEKCKELWAELSLEQQERLFKANPDVVWDSEVQTLSTKQDLLDGKVMAELIDLMRELLANVRAKRYLLPDGGMDAVTRASVVKEVAGRFARAEDGSRGRDLELRAVGATAPVEWQSSDVILSRLVALDKLDFAFSAGVAILIALLALYVDKNFGTFWSYAAAGLAGLSGTLLVSWQLLPWYRKYTSVVAAKA